MPYTKTAWNSGAAPGIDAAELNNLETQHEEALQDRAVITKSGDETINNVSTLQNDDDLLDAVAANITYIVEVYLVVQSGGTPDFKFAFTVPASATIVGAAYSAAGVLHTANADLTSGIAVQIATSDQGVIIRAKLVVAGTAGTLQLQWAQNTADVSDTVVKEESYMKVSVAS